MITEFARSLIIVVALLAAGGVATAQLPQIVINEFMYDDTSTDDREFVELFNAGVTPVDISGWSVGGRDASGANAWVNIPANTTLAAGAYYVIGQSASVANVNLVAGVTFLENDAEQLELWNGASGAGTLIDGVVYEAYRGVASHGAISAGMAAQVGAATYWGPHVGTDVAGTPLRTTTAVARHISGLDNNNNGRDFGLRPATPGTANHTTTVASFPAPNVDSFADGAAVAGYTGSFVGGRVFTPGTVVSGLNPTAIPNAPNSSKAITVWDSTGGGNAAVSDSIFNGPGSYDLAVYFSTANLTVQSNTAGTLFRGSEQTFYGLGSIDGYAQLADLSGAVGLGGTVYGNGATGVAWYYEKVGESSLGQGNVSEKLFLIDAGDGGDSNVGTAQTWSILQTIDLSLYSSDWYRLAIFIDALGNGTAAFGEQVFNFTTQANQIGEFYASYRENLQLGSVGVPTDIMSPARFALVPEPTSFTLAGLGGLALLMLRRRK